MGRRRVSDEYMASWFSYHPVSLPARPQQKTPTKVLTRVRTVRG